MRICSIFQSIVYVAIHSLALEVSPLLVYAQDESPLTAIGNITKEITGNDIIPELNPGIDPNVKEDSELTTPQLITKYGYDVEIHSVTTEDGYILELHRIVGGPVSPKQQGKQPILLWHGIFDSSATWVMMGPEHGLGYLLSDEGYDVWMGNSRGNRYSQKHIKYDAHGSRSDRRKYWSFSWHQMGIYDLPTTIDYIIGQTEVEKLHYVGHSQGTTAFFVMCAMRPEYNDKILLMNALAPVAFMSHVKTPVIRAVAPIVDELELTTKLLGLYEFLPSSELFVLGGQELCRDRAVTQSVCENILFLVAGYESDQLNNTMLPVIFAHVPAGAATNQLVHYGQEVNSGRFRQFDFGIVSNTFHYGTLSPPDYNITNIRAKVALHYGEADWLAVPEDVAILAPQLPNVIDFRLVPHKKFNHADFVWGIDVRDLLYNHMLELIKEHDKSE